MPHPRKRHLEALLKKVSSFSPIIGVLGHRQVGKTTLISGFSDQYHSMDDQDTLAEASSNAKSFLSALKKTGQIIDECQLCPTLFPALKERVRKDPRPGQFVLSGSVRFTSKELIRESLTGRIINLELLPMTVSELTNGTLPHGLLDLTDLNAQPSTHLLKTAKTHFVSRAQVLTEYLEKGGLPGVCFVRDDRLRQEKILGQLETILSRDLRQILKTTLSQQEIFSFVRQLARNEGLPISYQQIKRATSISPPTQKKLIQALEATFVLRVIPIEGDASGSVYIFEDQAEVKTLSQNTLSHDWQWNAMVYRNLREQFFYRLGTNFEIFRYQTRGGALIPFAFRTPECTIGIIAFRGELTRSLVASAASFLKTYTKSRILFVTDQSEGEVRDQRSSVVPASSLLF